jgi:2-phosphosulfolactate phosphatase
MQESIPDEPADAILALDIALVPSLLAPAARDRRAPVYIVVDVIRATTTLSVLVERGCAGVYVAADVTRARAAAVALARGGHAERPLLIGEVGGVAPPDFDFGNSPAELSTVDLKGRTVVFATTNGTRALHACAGFGPTLAGSLRTASATAAAALAIATRRHAAGITIVCAGRDGLPAYDDTVCAGILAQRLAGLAERSGRAVAASESARIALATVPDPADVATLRAALTSSAAFQSIANLGLAADLEWCAAVDTSGAVCAAAPALPRDGLVVVMPLDAY